MPMWPKENSCMFIDSKDRLIEEALRVIALFSEVDYCCLLLLFFLLLL